MTFGFGKPECLAKFLSRNIKPSWFVLETLRAKRQLPPASLLFSNVRIADKQGVCEGAQVELKRLTKFIQVLEEFL